MRVTRSLTSAVVCAGCMLALLAGCAKAPDAELAAARAAVQAARDAEADKYMPNNFQNVEKALAAAQEEVAKQESALFLSRNYTKAKQLLRNTTDLATQITAEAPAAKAQMREQVESGLASAKQLTEETRGDIKRAPKSKGKNVIAQMGKDLDAAESALAQASSDFSAGNIIEAGKNLAAGQRLLKKIFDQLSTAGEEKLM